MRNVRNVDRETASVKDALVVLKDDSLIGGADRPRTGSPDRRLTLPDQKESRRQLKLLPRLLAPSRLGRGA